MSDQKSNDRLKETVRKALQQVAAPELPGDLISLNMVQSVEQEEEVLHIAIVLPTPKYPFRDEISDAVMATLQGLEGIARIDIRFEDEVQQDTRVTQKLNLPIKNIFAVASGKGGVGKSTVATNLAVSLAQEGASVGLLDADIYGPNIPMMMGVEQMPPVQAGKLVPADAYGVKFISMGFLMPADKALIWRGPMLHKAIQQLFTDVRWGELDYMVVDLPPGTGDAQLSLAQTAPLSGGIIVTMPQNVSLADARRGAAAFVQLDVPILGVVENMSGEIFGSGGGETAAGELNVPFLGRVDLDPAIRIGGDAGRPIVVEKPDGPSAQSFRRLARLIALSLKTSGPGPAPELKIV